MNVEKQTVGTKDKNHREHTVISGSSNNTGNSKRARGMFNCNAGVLYVCVGSLFVLMIILLVVDTFVDDWDGGKCC